jgi:outer membrane autotransporter protein
VWGQGFGSWGHWSSDGNAARLDRSIGGFFIGADAPAFGGWRFGAVAGYSRTSFDARARNASGTSDNYSVGAYGGTRWHDLAFRAGAAYTWHAISTSRSVAFPGFEDRLKAHDNAGTAQVFGEIGYGLRARNLVLEPFANLAYASLHSDRFAEKGGAAALTSSGATTDVTYTTLGLRGSAAFDLNGIALTAKATLGWRHAFGDVTPLSTMRFTSGGAAFTIAGVPIARNAAAIEGGFNFALSPTATLGISYGSQLGSRLSDQTVHASVDIKF